MDFHIYKIIHKSVDPILVGLDHFKIPRYGSKVIILYLKIVSNLKITMR